MSKDLIAFFEAGLPATHTPTAVSVALDKIVRDSFGGKIFASFNGKVGRWTAGLEKEDVTGSQAVILLTLVTVGKIAWRDSSDRQHALPLKTPLVRIGEDIPFTEGVTDNPNAQLSISVPAFLILNDEPVPAVMEGSSIGWRKAVQAFAKEVAGKQKPGTLPRVSLETSSYKHPTNGTIYQPVFKLVDFISEDDLRGATE